MPSNFTRKANRKRQTRLTFDPIDQSSSPATMSPANVRYALPGGKRQTPASSVQKFLDNSESDDVLSSAMKETTVQKGSKALPTPAKSSQSRAKAYISDSEDNLEDKIHLDPPKSTRQSIFTRSTGRSKSKRQMATYDGANDSSDGSPPEDETPSKAAKRHIPKAKTIIDLVSDSDERPQEMVAILPSRKSTRLSQSSAQAGRQKSISLSDLSEDEMSKTRPKAPGRQAKSQSSPAARRSQRRVKKFIVEDESDDDLIVSSAKRSQPIIPEDDDNEDEDIRSSPAKSRRRAQLTVDSGNDDDSEPVTSPLKRSRPVIDSDDSDINSSPLKRRRNAKRSEDDDSGDDFPSPSKIRTRTNSTTPQRLTRQKKTTRRHRTEKEKNMELLRRRREGEKIETVTESEDSGSDEEDHEEELQVLSEFDDEESSLEETRKPKKTARCSTNSDESDFIVEDDDEPLGVPNPMNQMPLEFTNMAHKALKEHFKDVVEWMIHNKLNPGFDRKDEVYIQGFLKLNYEYKGYADSKFVSTQWTPEFTRAIYARPLIEFSALRPGEAVEILGQEKCEACNHRSHKSSSAIRFRGAPYYQDTLEEVDQGSGDEEEADEEDDEDGSQESNDNVVVNEKGQEIPSEDRVWLAGSVCKTNAEISHSLIHWKYHLNEWVIAGLEGDGYLDPEKIVERDRMRLKDRYAYANAAVDLWERNGFIKSLYRDFKQQLETARELKAKGRGGWK